MFGSIYTFGIFVAIILFIIYMITNSRKFNTLNIIGVIAIGMMSWIGVIIMFVLLTPDRK